VTVRFPVEAGHVMIFARALGDDDAGSGDSVAVPPTFTEVKHHYDPDWPFRPRRGVRWFGSAADATGDPAGPNPTAGAGARVHAETHFTYHRPVRIGDVLTVSSRDGATWTKSGRRGGRLEFTERILEYRDEDGELVITERLVGVRTERAIEPGS
jgi:hypothetical protein